MYPKDCCAITAAERIRRCKTVTVITANTACGQRLHLHGTRNVCMCLIEKQHASHSTAAKSSSRCMDLTSPRPVSICALIATTFGGTYYLILHACETFPLRLLPDNW